MRTIAAADPCQCGETAASRLMRASLRSSGLIVRCKNCALVRTDPRPSTADLAVGLYDEDRTAYYDMNAANFRAGATLVLSRLFAQQTVHRLLDVGCGPGTFVASAREMGIEAHGIEVNANDVAYCAARGLGDSVHRLDLDAAASMLGTFDGAVMNHVLEHVDDPVKFLRTVGGLLEPGAHLVVAVPDYGSLSRVLLRQYWYGLQPTTHLFHFERESLARVIIDAGFELRSIESRTTVGTEYHTHRPRSLGRRAYASVVLPLSERIGRTDQLIAVGART